MLRSTLSILALVVLGATTACGGGDAVPTPSVPSAPGAPATPAAAGDLKAPGEAKVGDKTKCPVSGEEFTVEATSQKVEHDGKTYYFCCGGCKKKFEADPAKYTKKS